jgi:3-hydroxyisobutyrate dehydrogenase-like beta-hydroxyacid dehydrogenase
MGRAYFHRARETGFSVSLVNDIKGTVSLVGCDLLVIALRSGNDVESFLRERLNSNRPSIVNLTTQSLRATAVCSSVASSAGATYYGGGIAGGRAQVLAGTATLLLGPPPPKSVLQFLAHIGTLISFPDERTAAAAKLLHNFVLILENHAIAAGMQLAQSCGISKFEHVLDLGTAGRPPSKSSVVRDFRAAPRSSYTCELVAKDLRELAASFPSLRRLPGLNFEQLVRFYARNRGPYTSQSLRSLRRHS